MNSRSWSTWRVVGVDPASGKDSYVFSPEGKETHDGPEVASRLDELARAWSRQERVLVCWDAPLSGLPDKNPKGSLAQRQLEQKLARELRKAGDPSGVSVLPFSCLPHWVITRRVLGLPRVGPYDSPHQDLPLKPIFESNRPDEDASSVVEVHPTLALWRWLGKRFHPYKGKLHADDIRTAIGRNWNELRGLPGCSSILGGIKPPSADSADQMSDALDARVAWLLGKLWLAGRCVKMEGNAVDGAMLLPPAG